MKKESNLGWARMYRPTDLGSYIGNGVVKRRFKKMLETGRVPQTILLEGDRGCGKTTLARIMTKNIMCNSKKENGEACDECRSCKMLNEQFISTGVSPHGMNVYEISIAEMNSVADADRIVEQMRVKPIGRGSKKVYILDEVQMASKEAQNTFLKVTEEPGEYLYVFMCTTNPEKLIDPFKSRFQSMKIRRPSINELVDRLEFICKEQGLRYDKASLRLIADYESRIPRESISKLEEVGVDGLVTYESVLEKLELVRVDLFKQYLDTLGGDIFDSLVFIDTLYERHGVEWQDFLDQLANFVVDAFNMKAGIRLEKYTDKEYTSVRKVMKKFSIKDVARFLGLIKGAMELRENPRYALTLLTLEMGYPEYLSHLSNSENVQEVKKESVVSRRNLKENQSVYRKEKMAEVDKVDDGEMSADDIATLLGANFVVELGE